MPARKPTGAATRPATRMIGSSARIGCQPAYQRMRTTIPSPIPPKSGTIHTARARPPPRSRRLALPPPDGAGAWCRSCSVAVVAVNSGSPLARFLAGLDEELHECAELRRRERLRERLRHRVLREAGLDVRVRVHDRLPDERGERLVRLLRVRDELVEVGPDRPGRVR